MPVRPGSTGEAVKVVQRQLNEKRKAGLTVNGVFGSATRTAVDRIPEARRDDRHGKVGPVTWRSSWVTSTTRPCRILCDYSVGNGPANWGTGAAIGQLEAAARTFVATGHGRISVGDAGWEHGGDIAGHATHEVGLDIDIRPIRDAEDQCTWGRTGACRPTTGPRPGR